MTHHPNGVVFRSYNRRVSISRGPEGDWWLLFEVAKKDDGVAYVQSGAQWFDRRMGIMVVQTQVRLSEEGLFSLIHVIIGLFRNDQLDLNWLYLQKID